MFVFLIEYISIMMSHIQSKSCINFFIVLSCFYFNLFLKYKFSGSYCLLLCVGAYVYFLTSCKNDMFTRKKEKCKNDMLIL